MFYDSHRHHLTPENDHLKTWILELAQRDYRTTADGHGVELGDKTENTKTKNPAANEPRIEL
jgi:hypothetical protein